MENAGQGGSKEIDIPAITERVLKVMAAAAKVPASLARQDGPLLIMNETGSKAPLIWCFNTWAEALLLGRSLDPDQPLIAMISLNFITMPEPRKALIYPNLIKTLTEKVEAYAGDGPFVVGGHCNAARVAEGVAHRLFFKTMRCPLLILLEHVPVHAYPGNILMLFSTQSKLNPFTHGHDFEQNWRVVHGSPRWGFIDADHMRLFVDPGLAQLSQHVKMALEAFNTDGQISTGLQELEE